MKAFFLTRQLREKILLLSLVLMAAVIWLSSAGRRTARFWNEFSVTSGLLAGQRDMLAQQGRIESGARTAIAHLDPSRTFDGVRLQAELDAIAHRTGVLNYVADSVQTERVSQFSKNSMQLQIRNADYPTLVKFYLELSKQTPYIGIEQFRLSVTNFKHNVALRVFSVEIPQ